MVRTTKAGFTIVELLIVIVVIGILAAITIVAFNGVQSKAKLALMQSELVGAAKKLEAYKVTVSTTAQYPGDLSVAAIASSSSNTLAYTPGGNNSTYCLNVVNGQDSLFVTQSSQKPQQGSCAAPDQLVALWAMNNNANDTSGNTINGTISGATATTGQNGQANSAYQFNGASYIALPASTLLNLTTNFSVSSWVKIDNSINPSNWSDIFAGPVGDLGVGINVSASGVGHLMMTKISTFDIARSTEPVTKDVWVHLVATYSTNTVAYYLDGQPNGSTSISATFTPGTKRIGSRMGSGFFKGAMDDLRIYNKVLSANEVNVMHATGAQ